MDAAQVMNNLWIGGWSAARDYGHMFDVIINVAKDAPDHGSHYKFSLVDGPCEQQPEFEAAVNCIGPEFSSGRRVLVHCVAGYSRSLVSAAKAVSIATNEPFDNVLERFKKARGCDPVRPKCPHEAMLILARGG